MLYRYKEGLDSKLARVLRYLLDTKDTDKEGRLTQATQTQTVKEWLEQLASSDQSTDSDSIKMANLLHRVGFSSAVVVVGIVYLEGKGTIDAPPASINSIAKMLLKAGNKQG